MVLATLMRFTLNICNGTVLFRCFTTKLKLFKSNMHTRNYGMRKGNLHKNCLTICTSGFAYGIALTTLLLC
jgi:hypothetical protein